MKTKGLAAAAALVAILSTAAFSASSSSDIKVVNEGDKVSIRAVGAQPAEEAPVDIEATDSLTDVSRRYESALRPKEKEACLRWIAARKPASGEDLRALLRLYDMEDPYAREAVAASLKLLGRQDQALAPFFITLLRDEDPSFQLFGVAGARQLRTPALAPEVRRIASQPFRKPKATMDMGPAEVRRWNLGFEALRTLSDWPDEAIRKDAPSLLLKRAAEAPPVAALLARGFWEQALPQAVAWSESKAPADQERAAAAWGADVPAAALRSTWRQLRALVGDRSKKMETRHQAALKLGFASDDAQVDGLLKDRAQAKDADLKLLLLASLFASRNPKTVPLLTEFAKTDPSPASRAGALLQLKEMLPKAEYRSLLDWVAANDKDEENRAQAQRELSEK